MFPELFLKRIFLLLSSILLSTFSFAQRFTVSGYLKDATSGESLISATVGVKGTTIGTSANDYGFFSLTLDAGSYTLAFSYIGYVSKDTAINLAGDLRL